MQNGLVGVVKPPPIPKPKKDPIKLGVSVLCQGCNYKKMYGGILATGLTANLPSYHHQGKGLACTCTKDEYTFLHGGFPAFPETGPTRMEHKTATLNCDLKNNRKFKSCIDEKYNKLWISTLVLLHVIAMALDSKLWQPSQ
jgi:hypothetical protein